MSKTINLRSRVVETTEAVPEPGDTAPSDTGSELGSERVSNPTPEIDDTHLPRNALRSLKKICVFLIWCSNLNIINSD